eukprot:4787587-Pyramimonas_sp.AAC.1
MRAAPLEPSVELLMVPRSAILGGGHACRLRLAELLTGHETQYCVVGDECGLRHWDLPWSFLWGPRND